MEIRVGRPTDTARGQRKARLTFNRPFILDKRNIKQFLTVFSGYDYGPARFTGAFVFNTRTGELALHRQENLKGRFDHAALLERFFPDTEKTFLFGGGIEITNNDQTESVSFGILCASEILPAPSREAIRTLKTHLMEILSSQRLKSRVILDTKRPISALIIRATERGE